MSSATPGQTREEVLRGQAWDLAFFAFGTAKIFERRQNELRRKLRWLTFIGIGVPVVVGGFVTTYGADTPNLPPVLLVLGTLGLLQLVVSTWALVARWDDSLGYASESAWANHDLSERFKSIAENPPQQSQEFEQRMEVLKAQDLSRRQRDYQADISDKEKRSAHREALRQFQRACVECKTIPSSPKAGKCSVCGNL